MKYFVLFFFFIYFINCSIANSKDKISYINLNKILNESKVGQFVNSEIKKIESKEFDILKNQENILKNKEEKLKAKKNILNESEFQKEQKQLKDEIIKFRNERNKSIKKINDKKVNYSKQMLNKINPIITQYIEDNSISLLFSKETILIGKKSLDITDNILILIDKKLPKMELK